MTQNEWVQQALQLDNEQGNNHWQQLLIEEGMKLLAQEENKWVTFFAEVAKGVASNKIEGVGTFFKGAAALKAMGELLLYTSNFLASWEKTIQEKYKNKLADALKTQQQEKRENQHHTAQQEIQQQVTTTTLSPMVQQDISTQRAEGYTTQQSAAQSLSSAFYSEAPSTQERISKTFSKHITGKITNSVQNGIVRSATNMAVNWTVESVTKKATDSVNEAVAELRDEVHVYYLNDQLVEKGKIAISQSPTPQKPEKVSKEQQETDPQVEAHLQQVAEGKEGDITALGGIAQQAQRPIYIYDEAGKLVNIVGKGLKGAPMHVQHTINTDGSGHWQIPGDNSKVVVSGTKNTNCLYDACATQMAPGELTGEELRQQTVKTLREHPAITQELFQTAEQLSWRNRDVLLAGGRAYNVNIGKNRTPADNERKGNLK